MAGLDVIKENLEYEQLFADNTAEGMLRGEYLIPDTHPDVIKVLMVEAKPLVTNKEVMQDRVFVEGQVEYLVIYTAREEEGEGVHTVTYNDKFSNYIDVPGAEHRMICDAECEFEHISANIVNERKISIESVLTVTCNVYKQDSLEYVKGVEGSGDIEMKKRTEIFDRVIYTKKLDLSAKTKIKIGMDKPQIGKIIKCNGTIHKKEVKLGEDKVQVSCFCKIDLVYKALDSRELISLEDDVFVSREEEAEGVLPEMTPVFDLRLISMEYNVGEDDLGEARVIEVEALIDGNIKVVNKENVDVIEDAYSPTRNMELKKGIVDMTMLHGMGNNETIIKDNIEPSPSSGEPIQIVNVAGKVVSVENKIVDNKVVVDGIVKVDVLYKTSDNENLIGKTDAEIPFTVSVDIKDITPDMKAVVKSWLENIQATIEAHTIGIKAIIGTMAKVFALAKKECVFGIEEKEGEKPVKKASVSIYSVQNGDTLWSLAKKFNTTVGDILKINGLDDSEPICINQKLIMPGRATL